MCRERGRGRDYCVKNGARLKTFVVLPCIKVSMQVGIYCIWHLAVLQHLFFRTWQITTGQSWVKNKQKKGKVKSRLSDIASEQITPKLSHGVLVARHVDRPWQVAWVHVAQSELLLYFKYAEKQRERNRETEG